MSRGIFIGHRKKKVYEMIKKLRYQALKRDTIQDI